MADAQSGETCYAYLQDHFREQLDPDLAAALNAAKGMLFDSQCMNAAAQNDEGTYDAVLRRFRALGAHQTYIRRLVLELAKAANPSALFGSTCAHAAADELLQHVTIRHHLAKILHPGAASGYEAWRQEVRRVPLDLPDVSLIGRACERESLMAQAGRGQKNAARNATGSATGRSGARKNINARMLKLIADDPSCCDWSAEQFALRLECSKPTVIATRAWQNVMTARALREAERESPTGVLSPRQRKR